MGTMEGWTTRRKNQARTREVFEAAGAAKERARLRPLLEQCEAVVCAQLHLNQGLRHPDGKAGALLGGLLADLRREMGKEE